MAGLFDSKTFLAITEKGLVAARSTSGIWEVEPVDLPNVTCLAAGTGHAGLAYAATGDGGFHSSKDAGKSWRKMGTLSGEPKSIAVDPNDEKTIYVGTKPPLVFVSEDGGVSWTELVQFRRIPWRWLWRSPTEWPFTAYVQGLAVSPGNPDLILVGIEYGAVVRSEDGGITRERHRMGAVRDCHSMLFHPRFGEWAYEAGGSGAAFSQNAGASWAQPRAGLDRHYCWAVAADPNNPKTWFVSASPGAFKAHSRDNAQAYIYRMNEDGTWLRLSGGLPQPLKNMPYALLTSSATPNEVFAGLSNGDIWHSRDNGESWENLPLNLGSIERTLIAV